MNMLLPADAIIQQEKIDIIIKVITETVATEKIFLLGYTTATKVSAGIFMPACTNHNYPSACTLLVLVSKNCGKKLCNIIDTIEKRCIPFLPVTVLLQTIETFHAQNISGNFFTCIVLEQARLLYDACKEKNMASVVIDPAKVKTAATAYFYQNLDKAKAFLTGAELYCLRQQRSMAAFMLHQAAEHGLLTLFKTITGFRVQTHNLEKLFRYCYGFSAALYQVFPRHTDKEERLFRLLQQAYLDTRYTDNYAINNEELAILTERIHALHKIVETTSQHWLNNLLTDDLLN